MIAGAAYEYMYPSGTVGRALGNGLIPGGAVGYFTDGAWVGMGVGAVGAAGTNMVSPYLPRMR